MNIVGLNCEHNTRHIRVIRVIRVKSEALYLINVHVYNYEQFYRAHKTKVAS